MPTSAGTKVTDPHSTISESVGVVTSDSLAAESLKGSGSFGEGNVHAAASKQPSHSTTTNNTDTSGSTKLPPAADAEAREAQEGWSESQQLQAAKGLGKDAGIGPTYNVNTTGGNSSVGGPVGGYAGASEKAQVPGVGLPKGKNLTHLNDLEGKGQFGEVGTDSDPSRLAEQKLAQRNAHPGIDASNPKTSVGQDGGSTFSALKDESA
ncbi:hypothetical protein P280DRAFT_219712 [Massarina eburnea CBS 473.64]|uniref:Uncharacterized protein n=1 Tax=Massarina eburnea CBS 473.64 TaxID=1395130 RepID=A0A6A6S9J4_9PLEO|nr:hypothetical protein P280DRAFT_219712 [Massarina eburnea CBS 473.64]